MDGIWNPIQSTWGVERNPQGPKANNSVPSVAVIIIIIIIINIIIINIIIIINKVQLLLYLKNQ